MPCLSSFFKLQSVHSSKVVGAGEGTSKVGLVWKEYRENCRSGIEWQLGSEEELWHPHMTLSKSRYPLGFSSFICAMNALLFDLKGFFLSFNL